MNASSKIVTFNNPTFGDTRTVKIEGSVYFVGKDSTNALKYRNSNDAIKRHCKDWGVKRYPIPDALGRIRETVVIDQANLLRLITHSKLPEAQKFEAWIFEEVIPTVLSTGSYSVEQTKKLEAANDRIEELEHKITGLFRLSSMTVDTMASLVELVTEQAKHDKLKSSAQHEMFKDGKRTISLTEAANYLRLRYVFVSRGWIMSTLRNAGYMSLMNPVPTEKALNEKILVRKTFNNRGYIKTYSHITPKGYNWLASYAEKLQTKQLTA
jgi:prophage antirepressor-like protein